MHLLQVPSLFGSVFSTSHEQLLTPLYYFPGKQKENQEMILAQKWSAFITFKPLRAAWHLSFIKIICKFDAQLKFAP